MISNFPSVIVISLFSGIGGFELAGKIIFGDKFNIFQFVEINQHAQKILREHFPKIPIWSDITTYHPPRKESLGFPVVIAGGFPCTNTSLAGKREGLSGDESKLWWEMYRVILECQPDFIVIENPEGIIHRGLRTIIAALRMAGYFTEVEMLSVAEFGGLHQRRRVFIIAYPNHLSLQQRQGWRRWDERIRDDIAEIREITTGQKTQSPVCTLDDGVPDYLAGLHYSGWWKYNPPPDDIGLEPRTPGRRDAINLVGRSVCPIQVAVVMMRLKLLIELCC
ncbi:MAG TPA: DNA (cytosine-5-)-methyltransferase [Nostocaceae cyanobacterium]|nr:DNA (cytosine-5-)-methyltransferase [Nostocaceae cyanobacterium]